MMMLPIGYVGAGRVFEDFSVGEIAGSEMGTAGQLPTVQCERATRKEQVTSRGIGERSKDAIDCWRSDV